MLNGNRPRVCKGRTYKSHSGCGTMYLTVNRDKDGEGTPIEIFCTMGKSGVCQAAWGEAVARLVSYVLTLGGTVEEIIHQLQNIKCENPTWDNGMHVHSCPDLIAQLLDLAEKEHQKMYPEEAPVEEDSPVPLLQPGSVTAS